MHSKNIPDYKLFMTVLNGTSLSEMTNDKKIIVMGSESRVLEKRFWNWEAKNYNN